MSIRQLGVVLTLVGGWFAAGPSEAAAKGIVLITYGEQIRELGPVSPGARGDLPAGAKVGYKSSYFGFFWLDCWTWGGTHCLYTPDGHQPVDEATAAALLGTPGQPLGKPFFYRFPSLFVVLAGLVALFVVIGVAALAAERRDDKKAARLLERPEYQAAAKLLGDAAPPPPAAEERSASTVACNGPAPAHPPASEQPGYADAVAYLVESGVERRAAERDVSLIVHARRRQAARPVPVDAD